ncbi:MAG: hypothetical protein QNJ69_01215 [Gammaproteobacteria bacterium]|nr:hypothetical protein [Gammaproteobacteria bacterium]
MDIHCADANSVQGEFVDVNGESFYKICHVDKMPPFFVSVVSDNDHWLFASSSGGLTAGRVSPETALFPYVTVDKIHDAPIHTGSKTIFRIQHSSGSHEWEPFNLEHDGLYDIERHLYKSLLGNKLSFEEINKDLQLRYRYTWMTSDEFGFVRASELDNLGDNTVDIEMLDGLQNILPAGTPRFIQSNSSNLVDAYKWTELDESGLAYYALFSAITDRAEPCESLRANTVFCLGLEGSDKLLSSTQLEDFRLGKPLSAEKQQRGVRGAYLANYHFQLSAKSALGWQLVANVEQTQGQIVALRRQLQDPSALALSITSSIDQGSDKLARIMAASDGFQLTDEQNVSLHHYANVLFNVLRGGIFDDQYAVDSSDFTKTIQHFNREIFSTHRDFLQGLPATVNYVDLLQQIRGLKDPGLLRLGYEYLPITFGRRHGDPSRPWNQFAIRLKDEHGHSLLTYQGNWRDIFQNWEALCLSYPEFIETVIAKFVNASTMDGYNPYRITKEGIDWEIEDPEDPWSYIGYWGDHQIIYLLKLLELSQQFHPGRLSELLRQSIFSYANVPYRIKPFEQLLEDAKNTVVFDDQLAQLIEQRIGEIGADGKLVLDDNGKVYQVNLMEKLLVPLLSKLGNLVLEGGIWMNTQRPEWNDANNALVGQGLSMVTLNYLSRYIRFLRELIEPESEGVILTSEVSLWISETANALGDALSLLHAGPISSSDRYLVLKTLGQAASRYQQSVYPQHTRTTVVVYPLTQVKTLLKDALELVDHSIYQNQRDDGLYHAYNLLDYQQNLVEINHLYPMLEGQVAVLSSGTLDPQQSISVIQGLFDSAIFRPDQHTFMLYPDRELPGFLEKNLIPAASVEHIALLRQMLEQGDESIVLQDAEGNYRFNADIDNAASLAERLDHLGAGYGEQLDDARQALLELYETVFNHQAFTGRSGGMFGFEGLGCIYWHMVSKLLLAVQETFFRAVDAGADQNSLQTLGKLYYRVRHGIGFNKSPDEYGAFPTDPYSHTPKHAGAQQPGMTGQVKEEILTRFGELGIRVENGAAHFNPCLLRAQEFLREAGSFRYLDVDNQWQEIALPAASLAFTWCQVPFIYQLAGESEVGLTVIQQDAEPTRLNAMQLPPAISDQLFKRNGQIRQVWLKLTAEQLFNDQA